MAGTCLSLPYHTNDTIPLGFHRYLQRVPSRSGLLFEALRASVFEMPTMMHCLQGGCPRVQQVRHLYIFIQRHVNFLPKSPLL